MSSLDHHLTCAGSCAGLAYRHDCPRCRAERLAGALPYPDGLLSRRARALVLTATLGASGSPASAGLLDPPPANAALGTEEADPHADDAGDGPTEEDTVTPEDGDPSHAPPITEPDGPSEDIDGQLPGPSEPAVPAPAPPLPTDVPLPAPVPPEEAPPPVPAPPATEVAPPPPADAPPPVAAPPAPPVETVPSQPMPQPARPGAA